MFITNEWLRFGGRWRRTSKSAKETLKFKLQNRIEHRRGRLVRHYFVISVILISGGLITIGFLEIYFRYQESYKNLQLLQEEIATAAGFKTEQFVHEIVSAMQTATKSPVIARKGLTEEFQSELTRLLLVTPPIEEAAAFDLNGRVRLHVSRFRAILPDDKTELPPHAAFDAARRGLSFFGPVFFARGSEPYNIITVPIERFAGDLVGIHWAKVNLKYVWEMIQEITIGKTGYAYIATRSGDLVAHPDLSLVLRRQNLAHLSQVVAAFQTASRTTQNKSLIAKNIRGEKVFASSVFIPSLDWAIFIEQSVDEAYAPIFASIFRSSSLLLIGLGMALVASSFVARRVVRPLEILRRGAERIGAGDLEHRIGIKTGDEIEALADEFNKMVEEIKNARQGLEGKVEQRTKELSALLDVAATATQSLDLGIVLREAAEKITTIFELDATRIYLFENDGRALRLRAMAGETSSGFYQEVFKLGEGVLGRVAETGVPIIFEDIQKNPQYNALSHSGTLGLAGYRFFAVFAIKTKGAILGAISCNSKQLRRLTSEEIRLIESLADQLAPAIENLNLFKQVHEKSAELEKANERLQELDRLKSHFLSNVSHELRTPLAAIGSLVDNMLDGVTGSLNDKQSRYISGIKDSSERLARLINDLLDLSVIESGRVRLDPSRFALTDLVHQVAATMTAVAQAKSVVLEIGKQTGDYMAWADRDRINQVLINLIGNAIKFTPEGGKISVDIGPAEDDDWLSISVSDTGPGIPEEERYQIFDEFYQVSRPGEEKARGVGLGLAISKKLVEMYGGKISVQSDHGAGSMFTFTVPAYQEPTTTVDLHRGARI
jgi:signal transduction histidine kinase